MGSLLVLSTIHTVTVLAVTPRSAQHNILDRESTVSHGKSSVINTLLDRLGHNKGQVRQPGIYSKE